MRRDDHEGGFTLAELMMVMLVMAVVLAAVGFFISRFMQIPREQAEQGAIVADAEVEMERMSDIIRNARGGGSGWLTVAQPYAIAVLSQADGDAAAELVRYWVSGNDLFRSVDGGASELLARSVRNASEGTELFTYYSLGGGAAIELDPAAAGFSLAAVDRVVIRLVVDVDPAREPAAATVTTVVTPRKGNN